MDIYLGIDPGAKGAICSLTPETGVIKFCDLTPPVRHIFNWLLSIDPIQVKGIMIEDVHSLYGMSASSNFKFGWNVGVPHTILECISYMPHMVTPKKWQKAVGVTKKGKEIKKEVAELCTKLYPGCDIYGPKGGLKDGRSDSLLIAHYCYTTFKKEKK